jgi:hypothetical protein
MTFFADVSENLIHVRMFRRERVNAYRSKDSLSAQMTSRELLCLMTDVLA